MEVLRWAYHSLLDPGNLLASFLGGAVVTEVGRRTVWKWHIKPHLKLTRELHAHLDPSNPFTLGGGDATSQTPADERGRAAGS